jgi:hypothetical protein
MKQKRSPLVFSAFLLILISIKGFSANFQVDGSVRLLSELHGNKTLGLTDSNVSALHTLFRPLLRPKLFVSDKFIFVSEWSLLEPTGLEEFPITGGGNRPATTLGALPIRGYPLGLLQTEQSTRVSPFRVNEMYMRWDNDVLAITAGRQSRDWGLGLIYDDGTHDPFDNFKSIIDGISAYLPLGPELQIEMGFFKSLEAYFDHEQDDATHIYAQALHKQPTSKLETGLFFELALLDSDNATSQTKSGVGHRPGGSTSYFIIDGFGTVYVSSHVKLSAEVAYSEGKDPTTPFADTEWDNLTTYAGLLDAGFMFPLIKFGVSGGYLRGDNNGSTDNKNTSFIFAHPNQSVGIMMTRMAIGLSSSIASSLYPYEAKAGYAGNGTGLMFGKPYAHFTFTDTWSLDVDIPIAWVTDRGDTFDNRVSTFMGVEVDVKIRHVWDKIFETQLYGATIIPGKFFDDSTTSKTPSLAYAIGFLGQLRF